MKKTRSRNNGFTLIELLVVITIIGILATFAVPAVNNALQKANQLKDVVNVRQLGTIFFSLANDENGVYPVGPQDPNTGGRTEAANTVDLFAGMLRDKEIPEPKILATNGTTPYTGALSSAVGSLQARNVGWDYVRGLTTTDNSAIPLFVSKKAVNSVNEFSSDINLAGKADAVWKDLGIAVYRVGNYAEFIQARKGIVKKLYDSTDVTLGSAVELISSN